MSMLPLDARIRELWKAVAITASETKSSETAIARADDITLAFIERFYPTDMTAGSMRAGIKAAEYKQ